jgi:hypothetical protein
MKLLQSLQFAALTLLASCSAPSVKNARISDSRPAIFPDYIGVTVPEGIAPLNFEVSPPEEAIVGESMPDIDAVEVRFAGGREGELVVRSRAADIDIPVKRWHELLHQNAGDTLHVTVSFHRGKRWTTHHPFPILVSRDSIDYGLNYRLIAPGYEVYSRMGIFERDLSNFDEHPLLQNTQVEGCMNCHAYNRGNPDRMSLHIRGPHGATLLRTDGKMTAFTTATPQTLGSCVYPYWHPEGRYIAYSTNTTRQGFHVGLKKRIEVFDTASDVLVYDTQTQQLIVSPTLCNDSVWETFPAFSADGRSLYFCSAVKRDIPAEVKEVRYSLCRVSFDPATGHIGEHIDTLFNAETERKSVSFPRPSYDGRHLVYTLSNYGNFSIWHPEADLWLLDLQTGERRPMSEINSTNVESYHGWSTNSRWLVFSSRRDDGLFTRLYIAHIDADGRCGKPFLLPQRHPRQYYDEQFNSYNIPEFVIRPVELDKMKAAKVLNSEERTQFGVRK